MGVEPNKIIYSMIGVSKFINKRPILKDIYLSFSTAQRSGGWPERRRQEFAFENTGRGGRDFNGKTVIAPGIRWFLEQEPQLDDAMSVRETVEQGSMRLSIC